MTETCRKPDCAGTLELHTESQTGGTGCLLVVVGLLLAPVLIGIPIIIYGMVTMGRSERWMLCDTCGAKVKPTKAARESVAATDATRRFFMWFITAWMVAACGWIAYQFWLA